MAVQTPPAPVTAPGVATANKLTMIVFSGEVDRLVAAFNIATGAAASGMDVTMFFTFWGLQALKKHTRTGRSLMGRMLGWFLHDIDGVGPSNKNVGGAGRLMLKQMMSGERGAPVAER